MTDYMTPEMESMRAALGTGKMSERVFNALCRDGVLSLAALRDKTEKQLLDIRNIGPDSVALIKKALKGVRSSEGLAAVDGVGSSHVNGWQSPEAFGSFYFWCPAGMVTGWTMTDAQGWIPGMYEDRETLVYLAERLSNGMSLGVTTLARERVVFGIITVANLQMAEKDYREPEMPEAGRC